MYLIYCLSKFHFDLLFYFSQRKLKKVLFIYKGYIFTYEVSVVKNIINQVADLKDLVDFILYKYHKYL